MLGVTALAVPATLVEGLTGWRAVRRSLFLARRVWPALLFAIVLQFGLPLVLSWVFGLQANSGGHHWEARLERNVEDLVGFAVGVLIMPLVTIMLSLVYLKARQAGGEPVEEVLAPFEQEEQLYSDWQARLYSSLQLNSILNSRKSQNHKRDTYKSPQSNAKTMV